MKTKQAFKMELIKTYDKKDKRMPSREVLRIAPNVCTEKRMCQQCQRGERYGTSLQFILHYNNGSIKTVCYACGKKVADETGLRLPPTPLEIEAREAEHDLQRIYIARQKMEAKK